MQRPLKRGTLGASTIILSKNIDNYAYKCGSNFYESDVTIFKVPKQFFSYWRIWSHFIEGFNLVENDIWNEKAKYYCPCSNLYE